MGKINYVISKKKNSNEQVEIILDIQPKRYIHYRVKTGIYITVEKFETLKANDKLHHYDCLYRIQEKLLENTPLDKEEALKIIRQCRGVDDNLLYIFQEYMNDRIIERGLSDNTVNVYKAVCSLLKEYDDVVSVRMIDERWLSGLITHMNKRELSSASQLNYWRVLKLFLKSLVDKEMLDSKILKYKPAFKTILSDVVYLTKEELNSVYNVELEGDMANNVRDTFIVQCLTGLRHSDMKNIYKENIQEDSEGKYIVLTTKKTMKKIKIYFNDRADYILQQHDYTLPVIHISVMNRRLPQICEEAGICGRVEIVKMIGNKRIVEYKEKYEVIKTHTARRTFISLMLEAGENIATIRSITGHTQLSSFSRYIAVSDKKKASAVKGLDW